MKFFLSYKVSDDLHYLDQDKTRKKLQKKYGYGFYLDADNYKEAEIQVKKLNGKAKNYQFVIATINS